MKKREAVFLVCLNKNDRLEGCVYLELQEKEMYLGMLTVSPSLQAKGIGKKILSASEAYAKKHGVPTIRMTVISVRTELIDWYLRHGYHHTGERLPFPDDNKFGIPKKPLEFIILKKTL